MSKIETALQYPEGGLKLLSGAVLYWYAPDELRSSEVRRIPAELGGRRGAATCHTKISYTNTTLYILERYNRYRLYEPTKQLTLFW